MRNRKFLLIAMPIIFVCVVLFSALYDVSINNYNNLKKISSLQTKLDKADKELEISRKVLNRVDILRYQDEVIRKKYPVFAKIVETVYTKSKEYNFDPNLIMGLIQIESNFKPDAISSCGAYGLMQVNYSVWKNELKIDPKRIFEIDYNIELGLKILKQYYKIACGDILRTLHLYNNGFLYNNEKYKYKVINTVFL